MFKKILTGIAILVLALGMVSSMLSISPIKLASSIELPNTYPFVYVYPDVINAEIGQTFTIAVIVYNLTDATIIDPENPFLTIPLGNMYGFDMQFTWDPTVLKYVNSTNPSKANGGYIHPNVTVPVEKWPSPVPPSPYPGILHGYGAGNQSVLAARNVVNETGNIVGAVDPSVRAWFAYATMLPAQTFNGNGTLFTMTFRVLKGGASVLGVVAVTLADINGYPIGVTTSGTWLNPPHNGFVTTNTPPVVDFTHWPEIGDVNEIMHFSASIIENSTTIALFMWDFGDGAQQNTTVSTVDHNYTMGDVYTVKLKARDNNGKDSNTATHDVEIYGPPAIRNVRMTTTLRAEANITAQGSTNVSELIEYVKLHFKIAGNWFVMNMTYNATTQLYTALLPAYNQLAGKALDYYVEAKDKQGNLLTSSIITYDVPQWVIADLNRDGKITILDIVLATVHYGKP